MYRFFDKHGKKLLAIASAVLIFVFLIPPNSGPGGRDDGKIGELDGRAINHTDVASSLGALQQLERIFLPSSNPNDPGPVSALNLIAGEATPELSRDGGLTWYLLVREAERVGTIPTDEAVEQNLKVAKFREPDGQVYDYEQLPEARRNLTRLAMRQGLAVSLNHRRSLLTIKTSLPAIEQGVARDFQQVKVHLRVFKADKNTIEKTDFTNDQLQNQFKAFAAVAPGSIDPGNNPFGFGYRQPAKLRVQYVGIPDTAVAAAVEKTRDPQVWEEDALIFYNKNQDRYANTDAEKASKDSAESSATSPTTTPSPLPYEQVVDRVRADLRQPLIDRLRQSVLNRVAQIMNADYEKTAEKPTVDPSATPAATGTSTTTVAETGSTGVGDFAQLQQLRDEIKKQFDVAVTIENVGSLMTAEQLSAKSPLGATVFADKFGGQGGVRYLFDSIKVLNPTEDRAANALMLGQPTRPLFDRTEGVRYIVRVVDAQESAPPTALDQVRQVVERDLLRQASFDSAADSATAFLDQLKATNGSLADETTHSPTTTKSAGSPSPVVTTDWFGLMEMSRIGGLPDNLSDQSAELRKPLFDLLRGVKTRQELPVRSIVKVPSANVVLVAELFDVQTQLTRPLLPLARQRTAYELIASTGHEGLTSWFNPEAVQARNSFRSSERSSVTKDKDKDKPAKPFNPLLPG